MAERIWSIYLSGEIHSDWRERIEQGVREAGLPVTFSAPVIDHALKEVDRAAQATARTAEQVVDVLRYVIRGELP